MFYKRTGIPEEQDIVLCTVKKILPHAVFVDLDEYEHLEGMIHISEIAPGRIRNLREHVREGKKLVCLVLRVDKEKKQLDLSLRRVPISLRTKKNEEYQQEIKAEKLLDSVAKELKIDLPTLYKNIGLVLLDKFGLFASAFNEISAQGEDALKGLDIQEREKKVLVRIIQEKIKPLEVMVSTVLTLSSLAPEGIEDLKACLLAGEKIAQKNKWKIILTYLSAPRYRLDVYSSDYLLAEEQSEKIIHEVINEAKKRHVVADVTKKK